jgi:thiosulfate reductase cytochrome b subunit
MNERQVKIYPLFERFWHLTTGTWRHYLPTRQGFLQVARFYAVGIFKGEPHPYRKAYLRKHNPLQAMAYLSLKAVLLPGIWVTGVLYLTYGVWGGDPTRAAWLPVIADLHVFFALALLTFLIAHLYMLTAGHSLREHVRPMITGFDRVDLTPEQEAYLATNEPGRLRPERPRP